MTAPRPVQIFLENGLLERARQREHNFIRLMQDALEESGYSVHLLPENDRPNDHDGLTLVHMKPPIGRKGLTFRRVYHYPFWQIDQTERRWDWDVARDRFDPSQVEGKAARKFQRFWRKRLYGVEDVKRTDDGVVYVPLQGKLTEHRSFQKMSPIKMLKTTLRLETDRDVVATLHPKEVYSHAEQEELKDLAGRHHRLTIGKGAPGMHLPNCAYVVTQNSGAAFDGFLFNRPAIFFAKIDFHHIGQSLTRMNAKTAFERVLTDAPEFAKYVHWFWQQRSINAGREDAKDKIRARFESLGWPM
jgi:hypothetical protein